MPKGTVKALEGFTEIDRMIAVAALGKKVARVVSGVPPGMANEALRAAMRDEVAIKTPTLVPSTMEPAELVSDAEKT